MNLDTAVVVNVFVLFKIRPPTFAEQDVDELLCDVVRERAAAEDC